ncbi:MAG: Ig-like domain-containing protein, partial [Caulobacteraceae bacterium]
ALVAVAPVANAGNATVAYDSTNNPISYTVTGGFTSVSLASRPSHGTAAAAGTSLTYTPASGYSGSDNFQYVANIAVATSAPAAISVTVNPSPPIANPVSAQVYENTTGNNIPLSITGGAPTSVAVATQASHGTATASGVTIAYSPAANYVGSDSFTYTASNAGGTSPAATASITVAGLTATVTYPPCPPGYNCIAGPSGSNNFGGQPATVTVAGGSGSYTYHWGFAPDGGTWSFTGQGTTSIAASVSGVHAQQDAVATFSCTVTDTVTHQQTTSNGVNYQWFNTKGGG